MHLVNNTSTTSKRSIWPPETHDLWVVDAVDSRLQLSDNLWYDDWASALGANTLGYGTRYAPTQQAASLPWKCERDYADTFCTALDVDAVRFFKTGSDALSCAVRLARAFTGRNRVAVFDRSYHGTGDWFGKALWTQRGIADLDNLVVHPFGTFDRMTSLPYAAIVVEAVPHSVELPPTGWLEHLREVCNDTDTLLIDDSVILGFRHTLQGYTRSLGVPADLYAYGKAMGQGAAISACCGRADVMEALKHDVHFSGTNNGEPTALRVAAATLERYQQDAVCDQLSYKGLKLIAMLSLAGFVTLGLNERFEVVLDDPLAASLYCFERGILFPGWCSMAITHTASQIDRLVSTLVKWRNSL